MGHKLCFFKASVRNVRDSGRRAGRSCWARSLLLFWCFGTGPQSWFCNGLSKLVSGMGWCSAMDSQSWFSGMWAGVATSPQSWFCNGLSKLVFWYVGWCGLVGHKLCFFKASVRNVRDSGRRAGRSCWARSLLLFWCFGIGPQSWFCNGLSKLVSGMGWCSAMDSQSWFSGMWAGVGWWGISFVFLRRQYATLEIEALCWEALLGTILAAVLVSRNRLAKLVSAMPAFCNVCMCVCMWRGFLFSGRQYATLEIEALCWEVLLGTIPSAFRACWARYLWCCSGVSEPARKAGLCNVFKALAWHIR